MTDTRARRSGSKRLRRALVHIVTLTLAPLLWVGVGASVQPASAVTKRGPAVAFEWNWDSTIPGKFGTCTGSANWVRVNDTNPTIHVSGLSCSTGWNWGDADGDVGNDYFRVHTGCDSADGYLFTFETATWDHTEDGFDLVAGSPVPDNCNVGALTIEFMAEGWGQDSSYSTEATVALGIPPAPITPDPENAPSTTCEHFDPASVRVWLSHDYPAWSNNPEQDDDPYSVVNVRIRGNVKTPTAGLNVSVWATVTATGSSENKNRDYVTGAANPMVYRNGNYYAMWDGVAANNKWSAITTVQIMSSPYQIGADSTQAALAKKRTISGSTWKTGSEKGFTDPANCLWTFGAKIAADNPNSTKDDPYGPLLTGTPPDDVDDPEPGPVNDPADDVEDGSCEGFSFTDPASWAGAGICVLVKAVNALIDGVAALARAVAGLAGALLEGIAELFIPSPSSWDVEGLKVQVEERPPGSLVTGAADAVGSTVDAYQDAGGGCTSLIDLSDESGDEVTCQQVKSIPGYSAGYTLVQVGIWGLVAMSIFNLLSRYFQETS